MTFCIVAIYYVISAIKNVRHFYRACVTTIKFYYSFLISDSIQNCRRFQHLHRNKPINFIFVNIRPPLAHILRRDCYALAASKNSRQHHTSAKFQLRFRRARSRSIVVEVQLTPRWPPRLIGGCVEGGEGGMAGSAMPDVVSRFGLSVLWCWWVCGRIGSGWTVLWVFVHVGRNEGLSGGYGCLELENAGLWLLSVFGMSECSDMVEFWKKYVNERLVFFDLYWMCFYCKTSSTKPNNLKIVL